jgi:hypothetical protein
LWLQIKSKLLTNETGVHRNAVFSLSQFSATQGESESLYITTDAITVAGARKTRAEGSCKQHFAFGQVNLSKCCCKLRANRCFAAEAPILKTLKKWRQLTTLRDQAFQTSFWILKFGASLGFGTWVLVLPAS